MSREWRSCLLKDVVERFIDYRGKTPHKTSLGVPLITAKIVKNGFIQPADEFIAEADYDLWMTRGLPERGDVVMTTEAPLGEVAQIRSDSPVALAQRIITLRGRRGVLDNTYLKFALQGPVMQARLYSMASGTTVIGIKGSELQKLSIEVPEYPKQCAIAETLGSFDDKIDCNHRINVLLLKMAGALFQHWFVDFGPFKKRGLQDSDIGPIPKGWAAQPILDCCSLLSGGTPKTSVDEYWNGDILWTSAKDVSQCGAAYLLDTERKITRLGVEQSATQILPKGTVVIIARGATTGKFAALGGDMAMNQTCYGLRGKDGFSQEWVYLMLADVVPKLQQAAHGTIFDTITTTTFQTTNIVVPPQPVLCDFAAKVKPLFDQILANLKENQILAQTRDYLLPKLISGQVEVKAVVNTK
jgi:type I restriction enzyme S subunit